MKLEFILLSIAFCLYSVQCNGLPELRVEGADKKLKDSIIDIMKKTNYKSEFDDSESSGDNDDEWSGSGSGEGSGRVIPTKATEKTGKKDTTPGVVVITEVTTEGTKTDEDAATTPMATTEEVDGNGDATTPGTTVDNVKTVEPTERKTTTMGNCIDCSDNDNDNENPTSGPNDVDLQMNIDPVADKQEGNKEKSGVSFTVGIVVGVVVGSLLAVLIIAFLVYRLRKKDEGSYSLDEQSSNTYLRADTDSKGKEYFA